MEIIRIVEDSEIGVKPTLKELNIHSSTFYHWYNAYREHGYDGLAIKEPKRNKFWNKIPDTVKEEIVEIALEKPEFSPRELAHYIVDTKKYYISESSVYRILKSRGLITSPTHILMAAANEFKDKPTRINQQWQTDFTYFKVLGWGWYYLSTVLDDYSRYIVSWELCSNMKSEDVKRSLDMALDNSDIRGDMPRLLSDNGSCYLSKDLREYLDDKGMGHVRGRPLYPQTQGKIERYHRSMKNIIKLEHYFSPDELRSTITDWVEYYNNHRYHESLHNLTPADVYCNRVERKLKMRAEIKLKTIQNRRKEYLNQKILSA